MFHLELFTSSIATGATTRAQVNALFNQVVAKINNGFQVPMNLNYLHSVLAVGSGIVQVQPQTTAFLPAPYPNLNPNNRGTAFESPPRVWDFSASPLYMNPTDELDIFASQNSGGNAIMYVAVQFTDGVKAPVPQGQPFPGGSNSRGVMSIHWTATATLTAGAWSTVQPTLDAALPAGTYALVGARVFSASALVFQMLPAMGPVWRPGGVAVQAYDQLDPVNQRMQAQLTYPGLGWGEWLRFRQNVPPQINIFATAADTAEEGWYDLVYVGP